MEQENVEIIDLDEVEEEMEESIWTADGINKETGEYNPEYDAWYPDFNILAKVEKELFGERSY